MGRLAGWFDEGWVFTGLTAGVFAAAVGTFASMPEPAVVVPASMEVIEQVAPDRWVELTGFADPERTRPEPEAEPEPDVEAERFERPNPTGEGSAPATAGIVGEPSIEPAARREHPEARRKPGARGRRCEAPPDPAIVSRSASAWTVQREVVQRYSRDWSRLSELGWSKSHDGPDGRADGLQLGGIRCGSDLWHAGLRSGDVVHAVNGRSIHSLTQAILAYTALRRQQDFEVTISRRGQRKVLRYHLAG